MAKILTDDEVLAIVGKLHGSGDVVVLAKSHEALRHELERVNRIVDVAVIALGKLRKGGEPVDPRDRQIAHLREDLYRIASALGLSDDQIGRILELP